MVSVGLLKRVQIEMIIEPSSVYRNLGIGQNVEMIKFVIDATFGP